MNDLVSQITEQKQRMRQSILIALLFTMFLWLVKLLEFVFGFSLVEFGIYPRTISGLIGIFFSPIIHSSFEHIIANSMPCLLLVTAIFYGYPKSLKFVLPLIYLGTGVCVWLFGRQYFHIGASGLTFGMMFFIFVIGILRRDKQAIALSLIVFFLYGGMLGGLLPVEEKISFETHIFGAAIGFMSAFVYKDLDAAPPRKIYSWEYEEAVDLEWDDENELDGAQADWPDEVSERRNTDFESKKLH
jgi:membrane associated rhomboid family serine protease